MAGRNGALGTGSGGRSTHRATIGALLWASSIQFFLAQVVVALRWEAPYSVVTRYISDLGNTACAAYPAGTSIFVCSPWHAGMNASFILLGITMGGGAVLNAGAFRAGALRTMGLGLVMLAGVGVLLVGWFPENESISVHSAGAGLNFLCGNAGMMLLGVAGSGSRPFDRVSWALGLLGLAGTILFVEGAFLGLGQGGMERVAAYPLTVWLTGSGLYLARIGAWAGRDPASIAAREGA